MAPGRPGLRAGLGACPGARGVAVRGGVEVEEHLGTVLVAAAGLGPPLVAASPVEGELADQVVLVEDDQVVARGEHQQGVAGELTADRDVVAVPAQVAA